MNVPPSLPRAATADASPRSTERDAKAWETAKAFEAQFLSEMLKLADLRPSAGAFGGGFGEEAFSAMLVDRYAEAMVEQSSLGLAEEVYAIITGETR